MVQASHSRRPASYRGGMVDTDRDEAALAALARAFHRGWPARMVDKAAPGWAQLMLVALRSDPQGGAQEVAAALLDEGALAAALGAAGVAGDEEAHRRVARAVLDNLGRGTTR
jgi:peptidoglycan/LPS O-acetylase OafA/YrhL